MKKGITLVVLVITIVVLIILTGIVVITTTNSNLFSTTQSAVSGYNKKVIIADIQREIQTEQLKRVSTNGTYSKLTKEEIIDIMGEHGTYNENSMELTTGTGEKISILEVVELPVEEYLSVNNTNGVLTITTPLTSYGYKVEYTTDNGANWNEYTTSVSINPSDIVQVRIKNESNEVVTKTEEITGDTQAPTVTISCDKTSPTNASTLTYTITFSETVTGFTKEDITVTNGTKGTFSGSGTIYSLTVTTEDQQNNTQTVAIGAGVCTDSAGNSNTASNTKPIVIDRKVPTVTINCDKTSPTNASTLTYTITFSETVTGFTKEDITVTNGTKGTFSGSGTTYSLTVTTEDQQNNTQTVAIGAGVCTDSAGNGNIASNTVNTIIDRVVPVLAITASNPSWNYMRVDISSITDTNISDTPVYKYYLNNVEVSAENNLIYVSNAGTYTVKVTVKDNAGNEGYATASCYVSVCFVAGTKVLTENGFKNIEDIQVGEYVYTINMDNNSRELKRVENTIISSTKDIYKITIGDKQIETTPRHEFYIVDKGWIRASELKVGDVLATKDNSDMVIEDIEYVVYEEVIPTYNLTIQGNHNYLVTELEILVHNAKSIS